MLPTYYLVCLHDSCTQEAVEFIANCLTKSQTEGGAELVVTQEKMKPGNGGLILHISAPPERLNSIASNMDLKKFDHDQVMRKFDKNEHDMFPELTLAEKHKCVLYAIEMVHFDETEKTLPGHDSIKIMCRSPVLNVNSFKTYIFNGNSLLLIIRFLFVHIVLSRIWISGYVSIA